ncbi:hypothetical protein [Cohnella boryungensis]|uniref:Polyprenyl synthetase n=1 Tax=Cohnella boryungensis TaxID=768479 RepID=A0ABV8SBF6_9BACL
MDWLDDYREEVERIFAEAAAGSASLFPPQLNEARKALLAKANPLQNGAGTNYICYLLPAWLKEQTASSDELCRELAVANIDAMLHFFLLDDAMDAGAALNREEQRHYLVLSQLLHERFRQRYGRYFAGNSPLWSYYETYLADWASAVAEEGRIRAEPEEFRRLARKSAPVKLCAAGMLLLAGRQEQIHQLEEALDLTLATLQLSDDWADWQEDLHEGGERRNAFLTLVRRLLGGSEERGLEEQEVKRAIYHSGALAALAAIAEGNHERLERVACAPVGLVSFHSSIVKGIRRDDRAAEELKSKLASEGGLSIILSNLHNLKQ